MENHLNYEAFTRMTTTTTKRDKPNAGNSSSTKASLPKAAREKISSSSTKSKHAVDSTAPSSTRTTVILHPDSKPKTPAAWKSGKVKKSTSKDSQPGDIDKPAKNRLGSPVQKGKPWGSLLKANDATAFDSCDPLRTLHFLVNEMQHKVKTEVPGKCV